MTTASAAGKAILLGEHAVVYGQPALAVPLSTVRATAEVTSLVNGGVLIIAQDLNASYRLDQQYESDTAQALQATVGNTLEYLGLHKDEQSLRIVVRSQVPIARGLGSGTAVATAIVRALAQHYGHTLAPATLSELVYRTETIFHGTPSGIDNTVIAYEQPVCFTRGQPAEILRESASAILVIADTGHPSKTRDTVAAVRHGWLADPAHYEALFEEIGATVREAREALMAGEAERLGRTMNHNHGLLCALQVSSPALDGLVEAARKAGALGAKLSGGGGGGCMIALATEATREPVMSALVTAGASSVLSSTL